MEIDERRRALVRANALFVVQLERLGEVQALLLSRPPALPPSVLARATRPAGGGAGSGEAGGEGVALASDAGVAAASVGRDGKAEMGVDRRSAFGTAATPHP